MVGSQHTVKSYDDELAELSQGVSKLLERTHHQFEFALKALKTCDLSLVAKALELEDQVDAEEARVDHQAVRMIATRQPMGQDLRNIVSAMRGAPHLERIGDLSVNIAKRAEIVCTCASDAERAPLIAVGERLIDAFDALGHALNDADPESARKVWREDAEVDRLYTNAFEILLRFAANISEPRQANAAAHMICIARDMERIGDHLTDLAEDIHYGVTGDLIEGRRPKADESRRLTLKP
ncbi:phosphate signaling complex protein PhoU [Magnetofaba australis]|nr:phosphate signaling complex protein PhoU [Magnetofaba australis]